MNAGRCAACKNQRRRCSSDCIFSPYFPANDPERFACVHKIYGGSNVAKRLEEVPAHSRAQTADTIYFEAQCRNQDPVYGCVGIITQLYKEIQDTQTELAKIKAQIAFQKSQIPTVQAQSNFLPSSTSLGYLPDGPSTQNPWFN